MMMTDKEQTAGMFWVPAAAVDTNGIRKQNLERDGLTAVPAESLFLDWERMPPLR